MEDGIGTQGITGRAGVTGRTRWLARGLTAAMLAGCHAPASPGTAPALASPAEFASWPRVTEKPVQVSPELSMLCVALPPENTRAHAAAIPGGPHRSIVVRVSPNAAAAYREGRPLPAGAVVVKEKYDDDAARGPLRAYGVMIKRAPGYDPGGGDWEYGFVSLDSTATVTRGRLAGCAGCHASARRTDYLFRRHDSPGE
ncbi:MAG TPA: cytochrome P460 family protein [Longimicrobium sp.]|nr:cytochrome P460 family protein [Longimicrobium sp.]